MGKAKAEQLQARTDQIYSVANRFYFFRNLNIQALRNVSVQVELLVQYQNKYYFNHSAKINKSILDRKQNSVFEEERLN